MNHVASAQQKNTAELPRGRAAALFLVLMLVFAGLICRSVYLQIMQDDFLQKKGNARYSRVIEVTAHRGVIADRNGEPLAVSTPVESAWASPANVEADSQQIKQVAKILDMDLAEVTNHLADTEHDFVYLKRQLPPDQAGKLMNLNLSGISLQREYRRYYPAAEETAQMLGFTGQDDNGQEGLELTLQQRLAGKSGSQRVIKDRRGHIVEDAGSFHAPQPGNDIQLSLDRNIQHLAYRELENAVRMHKAHAGAIVVLDAKSFEVLALANYPAYNPNNRGKISSQAMRNRAIADQFEPGSTMKPFTVAIALEQGKVRADTMINTGNGVMMIGNKRIHDSHPEDQLTVAQVIQKSSNVGAAKIALSMKPQMMWQGLTDSGFGASTGSTFPGEASGKLREAKTWMPLEQATMAFGHGISVNLLQLARAYAMLANDGELKKVSLLKLDVPISGKRVFSDNTARTMRNMLEMVVLPGGTAPLAQVSGYRVAGKTGTAHKLENGHYINRYIASFVGFAPASNPRLVVAVMIDDPDNGQYYGGLVAAPAFSKVMEAALHALNVPYDAPLDNVIPAPAVILKEEV